MRLSLCVLAACCASARAQHAAEITIGRTAAGQLKVEISEPMPLDLAVSVFPGFPGWAEAHPGLESLTLDDPGADFYIPSSVADLRLQVVSVDAELIIWNGSSALQAGDQLELGHPFFDIHPVWNIRGQSEYAATLRIVDVSGLYLASEDFEVVFGPHPCYANCDGSIAAPELNALDFSCFLSKFAAGDVYANCDGSTAAPTLNALDFGCFLSAFAAGCT